jgi:hypothetical protein
VLIFVWSLNGGRQGTLNFIGKFGLWELQINRFHARFYRTRDEAMKCVTRYLTAAEITERQITRVRELTRMTEAEAPRLLILELLRDDYPRDVATILLARAQHAPSCGVE